MSHFGTLMRRLRRENGWTLEDVARRIGSHKGYVSDIETGKAAPPSVRLIARFARVFGQDVRRLVGLAWVDKAPAMIRDEAGLFLTWCELENRRSDPKSAPPGAPGQEPPDRPPA